MAGEPRTIDAEIPGPAQTQTFSLPQGVTLDLESVYIEVDTSGAGGPVGAELTIAEQSGVVIAKKRQAEKIDAGGAGSATWALRLADEAAAAAGGITLIKNNDGSITVLNGAGPTTTLTLDEPWAMASGALAAVPDNSGGEPYPTGFPLAPLQVLTRLKTNSAIFALSGGNVVTKADGVYIAHVCLSPGPLTGLTLPLAAPPPRMGISVSTGLGSDPEPPFGQVAVYTSDLLGTIAFSTIASVQGATPGTPAGVVFLGLETVGNLPIGWWLGVIIHRPHSVPHSLYP